MKKPSEVFRSREAKSLIWSRIVGTFFAADVSRYRSDKVHEQDKCARKKLWCFEGKKACAIYVCTSINITQRNTGRWYRLCTYRAAGRRRDPLSSLSAALLLVNLKWPRCMLYSILRSKESGGNCQPRPPLYQSQPVNPGTTRYSKY